MHHGSYRVFRSQVGELALLQDHHVLPDGVQVGHDLLHRDLLEKQDSVVTVDNERVDHT